MARGNREQRDQNHDSISIISANMNRDNNLVEAIKSWIIHPQVAEIVIVDWSSEAPVDQTLAQSKIYDRRIRVIRVENQEKWHLSRAFNLALHHSSFQKILKLDADHVLSQDFFRHNDLKPYEFICGDWKTASLGQQYVNGAVYGPRSAFIGVNGWDERINTYGWDDDDFYARLQSFGLYRRGFEGESIHHLEHSDWERKRNQPNVVSLEQSIKKNREMVLSSTPWNFRYARTTLSSSGEAIRTPLSWHLPHEEFDAPSLPAPSLPARSLRNSLIELAKRGRRFLAKKLQVQNRTPLSSYPVLEPNSTLSNDELVCVIKPQHGLGNRLRSISSGICYASLHNLRPIIAWIPDDHCEAQLDDLITVGCEVISTQSGLASLLQNLGDYDIFDMMESAADPHPNLDLPVVPDRNLLIVSSKVYGPSVDHKTLARGILQFPLSQRVLREFENMTSPSSFSLGICIRSHVPAGSSIEVFERSENWGPEAHRRIVRFRRTTQPKVFVREVHSRSKNAELPQILIAADSTAARTAFVEAMPANRVLSNSFSPEGRGRESVICALAEAEWLSRCDRILGSRYSAFSELVGYLHFHEETIELLGG